MYEFAIRVVLDQGDGAGGGEGRGGGRWEVQVDDNMA